MSLPLLLDSCTTTKVYSSLQSQKISICFERYINNGVTLDHSIKSDKLYTKIINHTVVFYWLSNEEIHCLANESGMTVSDDISIHYVAYN